MRLRVDGGFGARCSGPPRISRGANPVGFTQHAAASRALNDARGVRTHLSEEDAIKFAISEYLHVDCRLIHARQFGRLRSHCARSQLWRSPEVVMHVTQTSRHLPIASHPSQPALTLVLRSTHSSQLNVGLLRFCFFLAGWSSPCALPSGDVDGCASSIVRTAARATRVRSLHP
jgi:hypothetical protein